jgi:hypothetical protein
MRETRAFRAPKPAFAQRAPISPQICEQLRRAIISSEFAALTECERAGPSAKAGAFLTYLPLKPHQRRQDEGQSKFQS